MTAAPNFYKSIGIILIIKASLFLYFTFQFHQNWKPTLIESQIFISSGDTENYLGPVESLIDGKGYSLTEKNNSGYSGGYAGRMPGFLPIYGPLYFLFGQGAARFMLVLIQFFLSVLSVYALSRIALHLFESTSSYWFVLLLYSISSFVSIFDHYGFAESLATSFLILSIWLSIQSAEKSKLLHFFLAGLLVCCAFFLRPALGLFIGLIPVIFFFRLSFASLKDKLIRVMVFLIPFVVCESIWIKRNYDTLNKFVPLEEYYINYTGKYSMQVLAIQDLVIAWGGNIQQWGPSTEMQYFMNYHHSDTVFNPFNENEFTTYYNLDSLYVLRYLLHESLNKKLPTFEKLLLAKETIAMAERFKHQYQKEKPARYYFLSKLDLLRKFLFVKTINYLPLPKLSDMSWIQKGVKVFYFGLYYLVLLGGILGFLIALWRFPLRSQVVMMILLPLTYIGIHAFVFGFIEHRYLVPVFPFFVLYSTLTFLYFARLLRSS